MATLKRSPRRKLRGQTAIAHSLDQVVQETFRLWRRHHLGYDQTKSSWNGSGAGSRWNRHARGIER